MDERSTVAVVVVVVAKESKKRAFLCVNKD
jgi:hypothetical protein